MTLAPSAPEAAPTPAPRRSRSRSADTLPLRYQTPASWVDEAFSDPLALLNDHAHLEAKAASNALTMLTRWPGPVAAPLGWVSKLARIVREEAEHLKLAVGLLERRGGRYSKAHRNLYAADLHSHIRMGQGPLEVIDRMLASALIEARSCERFTLLAAGAPDDELRRFYGALLSSEAGHFKTFLSLARHVGDAKLVEASWDAWLDREAAIAAAQVSGPHIL